MSVGWGGGDAKPQTKAMVIHNLKYAREKTPAGRARRGLWERGGGQRGGGGVKAGFSMCVCGGGGVAAKPQIKAMIIHILKKAREKTPAGRARRGLFGVQVT